ncbi:octopine dehydrogenase-like [Lineus longissimus]|uniref:octopine dehydrogenase-like n=1 Tax=Lineus longissimus TaxID=88925 RepID=UPI00315D0AFA
MSLKVCVCGGGHGGHVMAGLAAYREGVEVRVLTMTGDKAERWTKAMGNAGGITVVVNNKDGTQTEIKSKPDIVTKDPAVAVAGADVVVLTTVATACARRRYLQTIKPFIKDGALLLALPGELGFSLQVRDILGDKAENIKTVFACVMPWGCRFVVFGEKAEVLATKKTCSVVLSKGTTSTIDPIFTIQTLLGTEPKVCLAKHFLELELIHFSFIHPCMMEGQWGDWDGEPVDEPPILYPGITQEVADSIEQCSEERLLLAKTIMTVSPKVDLNEVKGIHQWFFPRTTANTSPTNGTCTMF